MPKQKPLRDRPTEELFNEAQWNLRDASMALVRATEEALGTESLLMLDITRESRSAAPAQSFDRLSAQLAKATEAVRHARAKWEVIDARKAEKKS